MLKRIGVIGAGVMGRLHARAISRRARRVGDVTLDCVVDRHPGRAAAVTAEFGGEPSDSIESCAERVDAVAVAVPTRSHAKIALALMESGVDVLVEKPLAMDTDEAAQLMRKATQLGRVLAVGHVEWWNPLLIAAREAAGDPVRIEVERSNPQSDRGLDIDVVQDFMLHDLDWVSRWVGREVETLEAEGRSIHTDGTDEAVCEIGFAGGASARLVASRADSERRRLVRIAGARADVSVDLVTGAVDGEAASPTRASEAREPLDLLWDDFLDACDTRQPPINDAAVGVAALELVERVRARIAKGEGQRALGAWRRS